MTIQPADPSTGSSSTLSLSLPPTTYAKLLPHNFLAAHLPDQRPSGRLPSEYRTTTVHSGSLTHAHGSAVVRIGDTAVVCGVRAETLRASDTNIPDDFVGDDSERIATLGLLVPNVELSTGCNPAFLPGNAPGPTVQGLLQRLVTLLRISSIVGLEKLCIYEGQDSHAVADEDTMEEEKEQQEVKAYYTLYIDILFLSLSGSAFDAAWMAVLAALRNTKIPASRWDKDTERVLCDPRPEHYQKLKMPGFPTALSWAVFSDIKTKTKAVLVDADDFEESCCKEGGILVVDLDKNGKEKILRIEKYGGSVVGVAELKTIVGIAGQRWKEWHSLLTKV